MFRQPLRRLALLAALPVMFVAGGLHAHSFDLALLLPLSGPERELGERMRAGFMEATREFDAHPGQESDGHLGGLDVYVTVVDSSRGTAGLAAIGEPAFLVGRLPSGTAALLDGGDAPLTIAVVGEVPAERAAAVGYDLARLVALAVRARGGDFGDRRALRAALENALASHAFRSSRAFFALPDLS